MGVAVGEPGGRRTVKSFCRICTAVCGILVEVEGDRVLKVRGDPDHPLSHGYTCAKGRALVASTTTPTGWSDRCCGATAGWCR